MSNKTIEAHEYALKDIFCDKYEFEIPGYQRPYSWEEEHAVTLVDDLLNFLEAQPEDLQKCTPYFLGSIVLIKPDGAQSDVVDGQQRLTTLTILFSVLRTVIDSKDFKTTLDQAIFQKGSEAKFTQDKPRLKTRHKDQEMFLTYIQEKDKLPELFKLDEKTNDSQENFQKNSLIIFNKLKDQETATLKRLVQFILNYCYLVVVTTQDLDSAYRIFSVMNDRGLELSSTDILKSHITGAITASSDIKEKYTKKWEDIEESIGRDSFNSLFVQIRMMQLRTKPRTSIVADFKNIIKPERKPKEFIDNQLEPYAKAYSEILNQNFNSNTFSDEINKSLTWLNRIDNSDWIATAIFYIKKHRNDAERISKFLSKLERLASILMINREIINDRIIRYKKVLDSVDNDTEFEENSPLFLTNIEKDTAIRQINGPIYTIKKIRVMVLLRLDYELTDKMAIYKHSKITVEHVMPQTPKADSKWLEWCPDAEEYLELLHRIGNLALLSRIKNSQANNYDFEKKKTAYFNPTKGQTAFALTSQINKETEWTPKLIRERQKTLVDKLKEAWDLRV